MSDHKEGVDQSANGQPSDTSESPEIWAITLCLEEHALEVVSNLISELEGIAFISSSIGDAALVVHTRPVSIAELEKLRGAIHALEEVWDTTCFRETGTYINLTIDEQHVSPAESYQI